MEDMDDELSVLVLTTDFDDYSALVFNSVWTAEHCRYWHTSVNFRTLSDNCLHFHLSGDKLPQCVTSQCALTAKHILIECIAFCDVHEFIFNGQLLIYLRVLLLHLHLYSPES